MARMKDRKGAIAWMANNPVAANLLMLMFLLGGFIMSAQVRQEVFPETTLDMVTVSVPYPGASPTEVEQGIVLAVEEAVRGIDGVKRVTAVASEGAANVTAELELDADQAKALSDIKGAVDRLTSLPKDAERPTVSLAAPRAEVISVVLYGNQDTQVLRALAEQARDQMLVDSEITQVDLTGAPPREIVIEVPQAELRRYNLTLDQVAQKVAATSVELPGGGVKTSGGEILVRTSERRTSELEFARIPIITSATGTEVTLGDIGRVEETFAETDEAAWFEGQPGIMIKVYRSGDQTPVEVAERVRGHLDQIKTWLPPGVSIAQWQDWSQLYYERMDLLLRNAYTGLILVLLSLGLFLELRLAFWVTMGIPISFLGSLLFMPGLDASINMISMFAFIVTLGMVVDDAIVVGENIYERRTRGVSFVEAAIEGSREVAVPVTFSIATTIAAFSPMFFVPGFMGKMFAVIPTIVISVLIISLVESLFVLPAHLGHLKEPSEEGIYGVVYRRQQVVREALERFIKHRYAPFLHRTLRYRYVALAIGIASLVLTIGLIAGGRIAFHFMPPIAGDLVTASVELPYGTPVETTRRIQHRLEEAASVALAEMGEPDDKRGMFSLLGSSPIRGGPRPQASGGSGSHIASVQILLVPADDREMDSEAYMERWRELTGPVFEAKKLTFTAAMGPSAGKPVDVELNHTDPAVLERAAKDVAEALAGYGGVTDIENGVAEGKPQLDLKLTDEAKSLGLTSNDIARQVRASFYGSEALRQQEGRDEVRVLARLPVEERTSEYNIETLLIRTQDGGEIPLVEAAKLSRGVSWPEIERADGGRLLHVTAEVDETQTAPGVVIKTLTADVLDKLGDRYPGLTYGFGGENREQKDTTEALASGGQLALIVIFALLAIPFKSYIQPVIVMIAIPFGFVGAVIGHVVMGYSLSMISMMGIVALSGVVINDSLVLIAAANTYRKEGKSPREAIQAAGERRFRPILLTSLTTFLGLMPMILETSVQARFLVPMAISLGFGVMFATFIILLLVPCFYMMIEDMRGMLFGPAVAMAGHDSMDDIEIAEVEVSIEPPKPVVAQPPRFPRRALEDSWGPEDDEILDVLYEDE